MKTQFNFTKQKLFVGVVTILLLGLQSCIKDETSVTPTPITPAFSIVGTWSLESASVSIEGKDFIVARANITNARYFKYTDLETTFTSDGKYIRGNENGTFTLHNEILKMADKTYSFKTSDANNFVYGNTWETGEANNLQVEVFFISQKILDNANTTLPSNSKSVSYRFSYKKKV